MGNSVNINGFDRYRVHVDGRVSSEYGRRGVKFLKPTKDKDGYLQVNLYQNGKQFTRKIHRLVAEHFIDNPNNFPIVNHIIPDLQNNSVENLEWTTVSGNNQHCWNLGRGFNPCHAAGEKSLGYKYDDYYTAFMITMVYGGLSLSKVSRILGIPRTTLQGRLTRFKKEQHRQLIPDNVCNNYQP